MEPLSAKETIPCDMCESLEHVLLFVKEGFRHVRCKSCGLVFVNPRLSDHLDIQTRTRDRQHGRRAIDTFPGASIAERADPP